MGLPSFTVILCCIFCVYIAHSTWTLGQLFSLIQCSGKPCYTSYLATNPKLQLGLFISTERNPYGKIDLIGSIRPFDYETTFERDFEVTIPRKTRLNGTLYLQAIVALNDKPLDWSSLQRDGPTVIQRIALTEYAEPRAETFNLLGESDEVTKKKPNRKDLLKPVAHFKPNVYLSILTDNISMSRADIPSELAPLIRLTRKDEFLPVLLNDFLKTRLSDLQEITMNSKKLNLTFHYAPIGIGKLRLMLHVEQALLTMKQFGFTRKDVDDMKGVFSGTNLYLLLGTIFVSTIHMLFDFLSFKNDVTFWRRKKTYEGLSMHSILWRGFSSIIIFLFLLDEKSSMLVLIPAAFGTLIELWKCKKILKIEIGLFGIRFVKSDKMREAEEQTKAVDRKAMKYLSYILYPLCVGGAIYSLLYEPHKSWYSWTLNSMVNGVYAFGFLFMLPQLFINYKLKSVAALPLRAFMYKAFNTFIDDIFAFIITMPTAHRLACFRDDIVFLIYLYQRWLYPVDASRIDNGTAVISECVEPAAESTTIAAAKTENTKKTD